MSEIINREIELDVLLFTLSHKLEKSLKIKNASFYIASTTGGAFYKRSGRVDAKGRLVSQEEIERLENVGPESTADKIAHNNPLVSYLHKEKQIIVLEALERKIEDTQNDGDRKKMEASKDALDVMDAAVVAPVLMSNTINAIMVLGPKLSGDPYGTEDLQLLSLLGPQLASALEKSRLYEEVKQFSERLKKEIAIATEDVRNTNLQLNERNRYLTALQNVTNLITRTLDFRKVTQSIADSIQSELGYQGGILLLLGKDKHKLFPDAVTSGLMTPEVQKLIGKPLSELYGDFRTSTSRTTKAIKTGQVQIGTSFAEFLAPALPVEVCEKIQSTMKIKTIIAVPIYSEEGIVGAIDFMVQKDPGELKDTDLNMMRSLCNQTGIVYRNIELYRQLSDSNKNLAEANVHLQQLDQAKSEFVSIASHQLRTPMTGIMGYLSMILQGDFGKTPKKQGDVIAMLLEESQRMIRLINLFLNVSKIESGKMELLRRPMDINEVIEKVISVVKKSGEDKKLKVEYIKPKEKLPLVMADQDKLGDVVLNLVDNAIKYTDEGSIIVTAVHEGDNVHVKVKDTGRGIPPDEAKKLFAKFVRGFGIAQVNPDGSGLGLYVARRLVEGHDGQIWVESEGQGKGATFQFTIPVAKDAKGENDKKFDL
ncbi:MAG: ATP-binding protein [Patescibacteria group bacterium]